MPFGGRQDILEELEEWRTKSDKHFLLLTAPAGRGKSALLARWAAALSQPHMTETTAVVFVPISSLYNTNLPELVFACIAVQLAHLLGEEVAADYINMPPGFWQSLVGEYLRRSLPDGRSLLLILDGLDEAAWDVDPSLFPLDLPPTTHVVVSARSLAGDRPGPGSWLSRLGWERFDSATALSLETLTRDGVRDVLRSVRQPLAAILDGDEISEQLYRLTDGDPLLLELYIESLTENRELSIRLRLEDLAKIEPNYSGFFKHWWMAQENLWKQTGQADPLEKQMVRTLLSILTTALGPLEIKDIKELIPASLQPSKWTILQALKPLRRFIVGDGEKVGLSFAHPRLADYFCEEFFDERERSEWQAAFIEWGRSALQGLQKLGDSNFQVSPYLLQYYSQHLSEAGEPIEPFLSLLSWEWAQSWHRYTGTYTGFLRDVDVILEHLIVEDRSAISKGDLAPYIDQELKCVFCHASVNSLSSNIPAELLIALRQYGEWTDQQVISYARQKPDASDRSKALLAIAPHVNLSRKHEIYQEALRAAWAIPDPIHRELALDELTCYLPDAGEIEAFGRATQADWYDRDQVWALSELAPQLPEAQRAEVLQEALQATLKIRDVEERVRALSLLAPKLSDAQRIHTLEEILDAHEDEQARASVLSWLASRLSEAQRTEVSQEALQKARDFPAENGGTKALSWLLPQLPEAQRTEVLQEALQKARQIPIEKGGIEAFGWLLPHLPEAQRAEVSQEALQKAREIAVKRGGIDLSWLLPHLPEAQRAEVLQEALQKARESTTDVWYYDSSIWIRLASYSPEAVYKTARNIEDIKIRVTILSILDKYLLALPREDLYSVWIDIMLDLKRIRREKVLNLIAELIPIIETLGGNAALIQTAQAIEDVSWWWS